MIASSRRRRRRHILRLASTEGGHPVTMLFDDDDDPRRQTQKRRIYAAAENLASVLLMQPVNPPYIGRAGTVQRDGVTANALPRRAVAWSGGHMISAVGTRQSECPIRTAVPSTRAS
jgi:hypothetical protein